MSAPAGGPAWRQLGIAVYLPTALSMMGAGAVAPLIALTAVDLGASVAEAAFVVSLLGIGGLVGALPSGAVATRFGERRSLVGALILDAAMFLVAMAAPDRTVLGAAVFTIGLAGAVLLLARQSYLTDAVPYARRARAMSTLGGVFRIGSFLGPLVGAAVISASGLRAAYLVAAALNVVAAAVTLTMPSLPGESSADAAGSAGTVTVLREHARTYLTLGLGSAALMLVRASRDALLPLWAAHLGISAATTSLLFALSSGVDMLLFYLGGSLMDRHGRRAVAVPAMAVMGTCFVVLPWAADVVGLALVAVGLGLGNGISSGVVMTIGSDASPVRGRAQFLAGWRLTTGIGQTLGPVLVSAVAATAHLALACWTVGALGWVGGAWLWHWLVPPGPDADQLRQSR